jgi:hypothetical protein
MKSKPDVPLLVLIVLSVEKFIQHMFVSYAFAVDLSGIRATVAVDYRVLLVSGFIVGWLFLINIPYLWRRRRWSFYLLLALALFDIIGEFIAQGTLFIDINVSFLVALAIVLIVIIYRRRSLSRAASPVAD